MSARKKVEVAAGVILREDGRFLLGQRGGDTVYSGYWEFPGGKLEAGETPQEALQRELREELGIEVRHLRPWITREHIYEHAHVRLHFHEVSSWEGEFRSHVHSALTWAAEGEVPGPMLPANGPVMKALRLPRAMGITHAWQIGVDAQLAALDAALTDGLKLVQIREKEPSPDGSVRFMEQVIVRAHATGAVAIFNGAPEQALALGADGVHLTSAQLAGLDARPALEWAGASCHNRAELEKAAALGLDYALLGPVCSTRTHPEAQEIGWEAFARTVSGLPLPVFALGGLSLGDMETARDAGAHGIAAIRGIWGSVVV